MSRRIWELDALRGLCILGMILVHLVYDIRELYGLADFAYPAIFSFVMQWGSVLFLLISGICVTLGHHPVRRGLAVFGCGMLCSLVTAGMYWLGFQGRGIVIWFGILHCDKSRLEIFRILKASEFNGLDLSEKLGLAPTTISYHMNMLVREGFVSVSKRGTGIYYTLNTASLRRFVQELEHFLL